VAQDLSRIRSACHLMRETIIMQSACNQHAISMQSGSYARRATSDFGIRAYDVDAAQPLPAPIAVIRVGRRVGRTPEGG
jgi:hypothetical protein